MTTTRSNLQPETIPLIVDYKNCTEKVKIKDIKNKIYDIEIPVIREKLSKISNFTELLNDADNSRMYSEAIYTAFTSKKISLNKLTNIILGKSSHSRIARTKLRIMYFCLKSEKISYFLIEKLIKNTTAFHQGYFEAITGVSLDVFRYINHIDEKR